MPPPGTEAIPVGQVIASRCEAAARFLEQALKAGPQDPQVAYLLAMAHKRDGKIAPARQALRQIAPPDANVVLQMGLLSLQEGQFAQAEEEFARSWQMDATCWETGYNLLLTCLTQGKLDACQPLFPLVLRLAPSPGEQRFLKVLQALCASTGSAAVEPGLDPVLQEMTAEDEQRLLQLIRSLGRLETVLALLRGLATVRAGSTVVHEAYVEAALVRARLLVDQGLWGEAERLLHPLARDRRTRRGTQTALLNLLGVATCLNQDYEQGVRHLTAALKLADDDPRIHQNVALAHELEGELSEAEPHWNHYFDLLDDRIPRPPRQPDYAERLTFEGLNRLASLYCEKERWQSALPYVQRAQRMRPDNADMLERLFQLYGQARRLDEARKTLRRLQELRPNEPQYELYELDLLETKSLKDLERVLTEIDKILQRYPNDARVEERAVRMVGNVVPLMSNLCDQLTGQLSKIVDQVRRLPNYQINWPAVHDAMHDLSREFRKLRRITNKCLPLVTSEEHRRIIRDLSAHIDRKIEVCESMGG